ncbi:MAG: ferrous iron transport protein B [Deltaproteobacteria bacterium]|nr:ferrous iron transport protein B [Deltaproteobacteria bacterium]
MRDEIKIALVGQPNCGKSTLFAAVSGYYVETGNFPGTTITFTETRINYRGKKVRLLDLPGIYSINSFDETEKLTRDKILSGEMDIIINVIDTTMIARSLELTLQLLEMKIPMVVVLNMIDEAEKKGIVVDFEKFYSYTGLRVFPTVAIKGIGISELFDYVVNFDESNFSPKTPIYDKDVEECIADIILYFPPSLEESYPKIDKRFFVIRLLEMDEYFERVVEVKDTDFISYVRKKRAELAELHNWPEESVFASHRHAYVLDLCEKISTVKSKTGNNLVEEFDRFLINPIGGFISISTVFALLFFVTFYLGDSISGLVEKPLEEFSENILSNFRGNVGVVLSGVFDGIRGGLGIVIPYFVPLIFLLSILEDSGILPRIAFMLDGIMHRFGLHGKSVIPFILGYGCNVPAIMAARTLENNWDKKIIILLSSFIPCSARTVLVLALITKFLGWYQTLLLYLMNIVVVFILSSLISRYKRIESEGFIMDIPPLRIPYPNMLLKKLWHRMAEFIVFAWPIIIISSVLLGFFDQWGVSSAVNKILSLLTVYILDLPEELGITLFLGIFRKELSLVMLYQALGTEDVLSVLSSYQVWVLVVFITFYVPCVATISTIYREGGIKLAILSFFLNMTVAIILAGLFSLVFRYVVLSLF